MKLQTGGKSTPRLRCLARPRTRVDGTREKSEGNGSLVVLVLIRAIETVHGRWTRLNARVVSLARQVSDVILCLLSSFCRACSLGTPTTETNKIRTHWLFCPAPLTRSTPPSAVVGRMWATGAVRCHEWGASPLAETSDYGTDYRLDDRYALCDHE